MNRAGRLGLRLLRDTRLGAVAAPGPGRVAPAAGAASSGDPPEVQKVRGVFQQNQLIIPAPREERRIIIPFTVAEILGEEIAKKLA
jgi:hypothetical protein